MQFVRVGGRRFQGSRAARYSPMVLIGPNGHPPNTATQVGRRPWLFGACGAELSRSHTWMVFQSDWVTIQRPCAEIATALRCVLKRPQDAERCGALPIQSCTVLSSGA